MQAPPPVNILIVDDVPANLLALEAILQAPGYRLVRASSGAEAIRQVEKESFAAILLDIQMPEMDGYETARRIKRLPKGRNTPILFVTAVYKEDMDARRGYEVGGLDYFTKPLDPDLLRTKLQIYSDLYRMTRQSEQHHQLLAAVQERQAAERALDRVLEGVSEGVIITDAAGLVTRTNDEANWIWGGSKAKFPRGALDFVGWWADSGKSVRPSDWAISRALKSGKVHMNAPIAIQCFDGKRRIILESASPLLDEKEMIIGAVAMLKVIAAGIAQTGLSGGPRRAGSG